MTNPIDYTEQRRDYARGKEIQANAAVDACEKALREIGVYMTDGLREALYEALEEVR